MTMMRAIAAAASLAFFLIGVGPAEAAAPLSETNVNKGVVELDHGRERRIGAHRRGSRQCH